VVLLTNFLLAFNQDKTVEFKNRMSAVNKIIALSGGQEYNLTGEGRGSEFRSFTMNYEYLLWWKGHPISNKIVKNNIFVSESSKGIVVRKK
jgi:hypothetical protein